MSCDTFNNIHDAYLGVLKTVYLDPDYKVSPRGLPIREKMNYQFKILNPSSEPLITKDIERNKVIDRYTRQEMELYNSCSNDVKDFAKASKFWNKIVNPDGKTINSAYGQLIWGNESHGDPSFEKYKELEILQSAHDRSGHFPEYMEEYTKITEECWRTPWEWAKKCLQDDKDTRQAILRFSLPEHQWAGNKDQVCTLHGNWLIRSEDKKDKLHLMITMRSNDVTLGLAYDLPWFCSLIERMVEELKPTYPTLEVGSYTHLAHSMHMYERDVEKVKKMLGDKL